MGYDQTNRRIQYQGEGRDQFQGDTPRSDREMTYTGQSSLTPTGQSGITSSGQPGQAGTGRWQGFVVPYRYYGPGYAGVGYYAVYYQGAAGEPGETEEDQWSSSGFDESQVKSGQGQRARAAWGNHQRRQMGGFAGLGPKGYRRSDERIREEINDRLTEHDKLDASNIEVSVKSGEVTLTGSVDDRPAKRLAEDLAERAPGVRDVMNQLKVTERSKDWQAAAAPGTSQSSRTSQSTRTGTQRTRTKTEAGTPTRSSAQSQSRQPVGAGVGGASDGAPANGRPTTRQLDEPSS
jgi:osmotically-inducible protein OsmY